MEIFKKIRWKFLKPGHIVVDDIRIDGKTLPELAEFPVLTHELLNHITGKYRLHPDRVVTVVDNRFVSEHSGPDFDMQNFAVQAGKINTARSELLSTKTELFKLAV